MLEVWEKIDCVEGPYLYEVSSEYRFRRVTQRGYRYLTTEKSSKGYLLLAVFENGKRRRIVAHRLIASAFIENPDRKPFINHINGVKSDNRIENLEWCTAKENTAHAFRTGLSKKTRKGELSKVNKLTSAEVDHIRTMLSTGIAQTEIARKFKVSRTCISAISTGRNW